MLEDGMIIKLILDRFAEMIDQGMKYKRRWLTFQTGQTLDKKEGGDVKVQLNFFKRFCKTHASYVVKDAPNIQVPPEMADQIESKMVASKKEKALYLRWKANSFIRKLKIAAYRGAIFGDMYFMQSINTDKKTIELSILDPSNILYDTEESDPMSPIKYVIRAKMVDIEKLKKDYPEFKDRITPSNVADELINKKGFVKYTLWSETKAVLFIYMDKKYIYKVLNGNLVLEKKEHGMDDIYIYHRPYIDTGDKYGDSVTETIYEAVRNMHLSLSFLMTNAYDTAQAPIVATGGSPQFDSKNGPKGLITLPMGSTMTYMQAPISSTDLYKVIDYSKVMMHFISGISEEAMAGFTGALTSAGVSIELRLDNTVREAIDGQIVLKDILEKINSDYFHLMEKHFSNVNLLKIDGIVEYDKDFPFTGSMLGGNYFNIVDFGGILPRSEATIVNNVLAKHNAHLISKDTALEELRYMDPTLEISKMTKENIDRAKLEKIIQSGEFTTAGGFEGPKQENYYMIVEHKIAPVLPEQNHVEHWLEHKKAFESTKNPIIMTHMMMHEKLMHSQQGGVISQEMQNQQNDYSNQPIDQQQVRNQQAVEQQGGKQPQLQQPQMPTSVQEEQGGPIPQQGGAFNQ